MARLPPSAPMRKACASATSSSPPARAALDPVTGQVVPGGIKEQTERTMENLKAILEAGGSSLGQVVKATVFLKDMNDFAAMNAVYARTLRG